MFRYQLINKSINVVPLVDDRNIELFDLVKNHLVDKKKIEFLFRESCKKGAGLIAKWLWQLDNTIDIRANNENAFRATCLHGHLEVAKWLWQLDNTIDIHAENEETFRYACQNGNLEVAKWLWQLDNTINIHAWNEYAFRNSCQNGARLNNARSCVI